MNDQSTRSPFAPLMILALALLLWFGFQCVSLIDERQKLDSLQSSQDPLLQNAKKVRSTLDALTQETEKLADKGNLNAKMIVDELKRRGISTRGLAPGSPAPEKK